MKEKNKTLLLKGGVSKDESFFEALKRYTTNFGKKVKNSLSNIDFETQQGYETKNEEENNSYINNPSIVSKYSNKIEKLNFQRSLIDNNFRKTSQTIKDGYKKLDSFAEKIAKEYDKQEQKRLSEMFLQSKEQLKKADEHVQKMQFYNEQEMDDELEKEMKRNEKEMAEAFGEIETPNTYDETLTSTPSDKPKNLPRGLNAMSAAEEKALDKHNKELIANMFDYDTHNQITQATRNTQIESPLEEFAKNYKEPTKKEKLENLKNSVNNFYPKTKAKLYNLKDELIMFKKLKPKTLEYQKKQEFLQSFLKREQFNLDHQKKEIEKLIENIYNTSSIHTAKNRLSQCERLTNSYIKNVNLIVKIDAYLKNGLFDEALEEIENQLQENNLPQEFGKTVVDAIPLMHVLNETIKYDTQLSKLPKNVAYKEALNKLHIQTKALSRILGPLNFVIEVKKIQNQADIEGGLQGYISGGVALGIGSFVYFITPTHPIFKATAGSITQEIVDKWIDYEFDKYRATSYDYSLNEAIGRSKLDYPFTKF